MRLRSLASLAVLVAGLSAVVLLTRHIHLTSDVHGGADSTDFKVSELLSDLSKRGPPEPEDTEATTPAATEQPSSCSGAVQLCQLPKHMIYWRDAESDCGVRTPLRCGGASPKYVTFQPDAGGWNNIRMAMETAVIYAAATGRTLVLPKKQFFYLLTKKSDWTENRMEFDDIYHMDKLTDVLDMISMRDFLTKEGHPQGALKEPYPYLDTLDEVKQHELFKWIQERVFQEQPSTDRRVMGFTFNFSFATDVNACDNPQADDLFSLGVKADERLKSFVLHRVHTEYDKTMHNHPVIHFPSRYEGGYRLLTHFYTWLYFSDVKADRFYKRFARDRLRYKDEIWCAAAKIVTLMHQKASAKGANYTSYHIRRGDFQFKETRVEISAILEATRDLLIPNQVIYISTDEKDKSLFEPFLDAGFEIHFFLELAIEAGLGSRLDFAEDQAGPRQARPGASVLNMNHVGMIEQIVCANAHTFIGTPFSTFTGFITRMRGYYNDVRSQRTFYTLPKYKYQLKDTPQFVGPLWSREFEAAWKNIEEE